MERFIVSLLLLYEESQCLFTAGRLNNLKPYSLKLKTGDDHVWVYEFNTKWDVFRYPSRHRSGFGSFVIVIRSV